MSVNDNPLVPQTILVARHVYPPESPACSVARESWRVKWLQKRRWL